MYIGCLVPVPPEGALFHVDDSAAEIKHDQELSYTCGRGFDSKFDNISQSFPAIQCVGGVWEGESPSCEGRHVLFKLSCVPSIDCDCSELYIGIIQSDLTALASRNMLGYRSIIMHDIGVVVYDH